MTDPTPADRRRHRTVLHDPLIDVAQADSARTDRAGATPPDAPAPAGLPASRRKSRHPALSARILATGLATTGTLGLTAGYAFSAPAKSSPTPGSDTGTATVPGADTAAVAPADTTPSAAPAPSQAPAPPAAGQPAITVAPPVVVLEVPTIAPATPGSNAGSGNQWAPDPSNQQSSGSN